MSWQLGIPAVAPPHRTPKRPSPKWSLLQNPPPVGRRLRRTNGCWNAGRPIVFWVHRTQSTLRRSPVCPLSRGRLPPRPTPRLRLPGQTDNSPPPSANPQSAIRNPQSSNPKSAIRNCPDRTGHRHSKIPVDAAGPPDPRLRPSVQPVRRDCGLVQRLAPAHAPPGGHPRRSLSHLGCPHPHWPTANCENSPEAYRSDVLRGGPGHGLQIETASLIRCIRNDILKIRCRGTILCHGINTEWSFCFNLPS
jgi:hypothetical protein